jgi:uncharacterized protein YegL
MSSEKTAADLLNKMLREDFIENHVDLDEVKPGAIIISKDMKRVQGPGKPTAIMLVLDVSGSTSPFINQMNTGVRQFICDCMNDDSLAYDGHLAIVTFNHSATVLVPFTKLCYLKDVPSLNSSGGTDIAAGVNTALNLFEEYYFDMKGIPKNRAIVVIASDGQIGESEDLNKSAARCIDLVKANKILSFPAAIDGASKDSLRKFSLNNEVFSFEGSDFVKFMQQISYISSNVQQFADAKNDEYKGFTVTSNFDPKITRD